MKPLGLSLLCLLAGVAACNNSGKNTPPTDSTIVESMPIAGFGELVRELPMLDRENIYAEMKLVAGNALVPDMISENYRDVYAAIFRKAPEYVALYFRGRAKTGFDHGFLFTFDPRGRVIDYKELEVTESVSGDAITNENSMSPVFVNDSTVQARKYEYSYDSEKEAVLTDKGSIETYKIDPKGRIALVPMEQITFSDYGKLFPDMSFPLVLTGKPKFNKMTPVSLLMPFLNYREFVSDPQLAYYPFGKMQSGKYVVLIYGHEALSNGGEGSRSPSYDIFVHNSEGKEIFRTILLGGEEAEYYSDVIDTAIIHADGSMYQHEIIDNTFYDVAGDNDLKTVSAMLLRVNDAGKLAGVIQRYEISSESFSPAGVKQVLDNHKEYNKEGGHSYAHIERLDFKKPVFLFRHVYTNKSESLVELLLVSDDLQVTDRLIMQQTPGGTPAEVTVVPEDNSRRKTPGTVELTVPAQLKVNDKWITITPEGKFSEKI